MLFSWASTPSFQAATWWATDMRRKLATRPYLVVPEAMVTTTPKSGWEFQREDGVPETIEDNGTLPAWDTELKFTLRRSFDVRADVRNAIALNDRAEIRLVTRLETARGLDSRIVDTKTIAAGESLILVEIRPDSRTLASGISLVSALVLVDAANPENPLAPRDSGDRVWESIWTARIEGGRARLPMEPVSFSAALSARGIAHALFHVEVADYPELDFEQAVCVYLNTDFPQFVRAVETSSPGETAILWDGVLRRVLATGLAPHFASTGPWPEGSLGAQVDAWISGVFPGATRDVVSRLRIDEPSRFEAQIQSWARIASNMGFGST